MFTFLERERERERRVNFLERIKKQEKKRKNIKKTYINYKKEIICKLLNINN